MKALPLLTASVIAITCAGAHAANISISEEITPASVEASSTFSAAQSAQNLINHSGLTGERHDADGGANTMWHSNVQPEVTAPALGLPAVPAWLRFTFKEARQLDEIRIWNHNQPGLTNRGFAKARVYGTSDGKSWFKLTQDDIIALPEGGTKVAVVPLQASRPVLTVILAAEGNYGGDCYGLSEVHFVDVRQVEEADVPFPGGIACEAKPYYRHRPDGKAGREITVQFTGGKLYGSADAQVAVVGGATETIKLNPAAQGSSEASVLLPVGVGVDREAEVVISIKRGAKTIEQRVAVPAKRQWTVFIYPHSHVDIGYTNTQANVELIHKRNLLTGIELAKKTADWPEGSRYVWNPEVTWPVERYLATATKEERETIMEAIRKGWVSIDAGYINDNTSVACDEEFFPFFSFKHKLEKETGVPIRTMVQVDVPGMSWGIVPAAAQNGIRYILSFHNGGDRTGHTNDMNHRPCWWQAPDGKSRVLFLQPGSYVPGATIKGYRFYPQMMGQTDPEKLLRIVKTDNPRNNFADRHFMPLTSQLESNPAYPYDLFVMSWCMADNTPVDADLPEAVRSWNAEYAYPHLVIAGADTIMSAFEKKYGDKLPVVAGDFTEYWSDGLGTAAQHTAMNRSTKERLIQADTLWSMLQPGKAAPREEFEESWRHVVLGSEHTWAFADPNRQPLQDEILAVKFGYFQKAHDLSVGLMQRALAPVATAGGNQIAVFNTLSWPRTGVATLSAAQSKAGDGVNDASGNPVPSQRLSTGELAFIAKDVPAFGAANYMLGAKNGAIPQQPAKAQGLTLDNGLVKVVLDPTTGDIASLISGGREFVDASAPCRINSFRYLRGGDSDERATGPSDVKISVREAGPLVASLLVESKADGCNRLLREVRITLGSPEVACNDLVDKVATKEKEGVHFGFAFDLPGAKTRADIPWGVMEVEKDQMKAGNRNWICFQRWLDVSNEQAGVTWASLDAPTFEYGRMSANVIGAATNSPIWIQELKPSSTIYSWALNNHWHTNFPLSQSGKILFRYRLLPHSGGFDAVAANRFGNSQVQPLIATLVNGSQNLVPRVKLDNPRVTITIQREEAGGKLVLRLRSLSDKEEKAVLTFADGRTKECILAPWSMTTIDGSQ